MRRRPSLRDGALAAAKRVGSALLGELELAAAEVEAVGGGSGGGKDVGVQAIDDETPLFLGFDDFFAFQDLQVVRDVGDLSPQLGGDLAHILGTGAEQLDDPQAVGIGQGLEPIGAFVRRQRILHWRPPSRGALGPQLEPSR